MSAAGAPTARVLRWAAWTPGRERQEDWKAWACSPEALPPEGHPEARFLPSMLRRRCSPLSRIVLTAAFACLDGDEPRSVRTVFASRHGSVNESLGLLERLVTKQRLSPAKFSHTVHNAQAGLFCIAVGNHHGSSSLAAREDTFACGFVEALGHLQREPSRRVLYVMGDGPLAPTFANLIEEPPGSYAVALLLGGEGDGPELRLEPLETESAPARPWPDAAEFLRWVLSDERDLRLGRFRWTRA